MTSALRVRPAASFRLPAPQRRRWAEAGVLLVVVALLASSVVAEVLLGCWSTPAAQLTSLLVNGAAYLGCALLVPVVVHVRRRHPCRRGQRLRALAWHAAAALLFAGAMAAAILATTVVRQGRPVSLESLLVRYERTFRYNLHDPLLVYAVLAGSAGAFALHRAQRRRELSAARLERRVASARLEALRMQVDPHFLFNTLGALLPLVTTRPERAVETVIRLGTLLRLGFRTAADGLVPLHDEVDYARAFLEIEELRLSDRLCVIVETAPGVLDAAIPGLALKPFVEAALAATAFRRPGNATVEIAARRRDGEVEVRVRARSEGQLPEGPALDAPGIEAARRRMERAFGRGQSVELARGEQGGFEATLRFPYRTVPRHKGAPPVRKEPEPPRPPAARGLGLPSRPAAVVLAVSALWLAAGLFYGSQAHLRTTVSRGEAPVSLVSLYAVPLLRASVWALLSVAVVRLHGRLPLSGPGALRRLPVHAAAALVCGTVVIVAVHPLLALVGTRSSWQSSGLALRLETELPGEVMTYFLFVGLLVVLDLVRRLHVDELRVARLEAQLTGARLATLRSQLHPHFLFNTLNSLLPLIGSEPETATRLLIKLGDLLRASLRHDAEQVVPLRDEMEFLGHYLDIERVRFRDRLSLEVDVSAEALGASVPNLILQPLVENAVKHGIAREPGPCRLVVSGARRGDDLVLSVWNSLPSAEAGPVTAGEGIGLANTRERLEQHFPGRSGLTAARGDDGGFRATLALPFVAAPPRAGAPSGASGLWPS